jgi:hypothetical protein
MRSVWVGIHPHAEGTPILAMAGAEATLLKARLATEPRHPRALATLLEGLALWQGVPVQAALVVGAPEAASYDTRRFHDSFADSGPTPLYSVEYVPDLRRRRHRDGLEGLGDFWDLRQLLLFEVAR